MKKSILFAMLSCAAMPLQAQVNTAIELPTASPRAWVGLQLGLTDVQIKYGSPALNGRDVWHTAGIIDQGETPMPWRGGADMATTLSVSTPVQVGDKALAAGTYSLYFIVNADRWTLVLNREAQQWGAYFYDPKADVLRLDLSPADAPEAVPAIESLTYTLARTAPDAAQVKMAWGRRSVSFTLKVDLGATVVASLQQQLKGREAFNWAAWQTAADWCLQNNTHLDEALAWTQKAQQPPFGPDQPRVEILTTRAGLLAKLGRADEATKADQQALDLSTPQDLLQRAVNQYRASDKLKAKATIDFAQKKFPTAWQSANVMGYWFRMEGDLKQALVWYTKARDLCTDAQTKAGLADRVKSLEAQLKPKS